MEIKLIYCTAGSREEAQGIAEKVVHERLAACANILPGIQSVYQWEGRMQQAEEALLLLKTQSGRVDDLIQRVRELHSYDCPCIVVLPVQQGHGPFLEWVCNETASQAE